jgi:hypothetical protein
MSVIVFATGKKKGMNVGFPNPGVPGVVAIGGWMYQVAGIANCDGTPVFPFDTISP